jgi:hypothetical protein
MPAVITAIHAMKNMLSNKTKKSVPISQTSF